MKWRLEEGQGEAIYEIGVEDNGLLVGLTEDELKASMHTLEQMADRYLATGQLSENMIKVKHPK